MIQENVSAIGFKKLEINKPAAEGLLRYAGTREASRFFFDRSPRSCPAGRFVCAGA